jgi:hypothetical protein
MAAVLTAASVLQCAHGAQLVITPSQQLLKVAGQSVLVRADLAAATIPACPATPTPCGKVATITAAGLSEKLKVGGEPVALESATGTTAVATWRVTSAGLTKLEAA